MDIFSAATILRPRLYAHAGIDFGGGLPKLKLTVILIDLPSAGSNQY
jgi:hypothetical protein